ncbi:MAG: hypothetical protein WCR67_00250 [Bacilli bacterium]
MSEKQKKVIYVEEDEDDEEVKPRKPKGTPSGFSSFLNKYFHHLDRGTSLHGEINSGIFVFLLAICMIIVNVQIMGNAMNGSYTISTSPNDATNIAMALNYATLYVGSIIIAFVGSLLMGLVAKLPFVQIANLGLASSIISLVGSTSGLTYYNLLFINLLRSLLYVIVSSVPLIRDFYIRSIPKGVRKALPAAMGILLFVTCLSLSGIISLNTISGGLAGGVTVFGLADISSMSLLMTEAFTAIIIGIIVYAVLKAMKVKKSLFYGFLTATVLYFVINILAKGLNIEANTSNTDSVFNFGRIWVIAGSQASPVTPFGDSYLSYVGSAIGNLFSSLPKVFTEGTDFSACTGNAFLLIVGGMLNCFFLAMSDFDATILGTKNILNKDVKDEKYALSLEEGKDGNRARVVNAGMNVVAPFFGQGQVTLSKSSLAGIIDSGKSGIVPVVSSIGFLICLFILAIPALLSTTFYPVNSMSQWNYFAYGNGGFIYLFQGLSFAIADVVIALCGISMLRNLADLDWKDYLTAIPAIATILASLVFYSLAIGVLLGVVVYTVLKFLNVRADNSVSLFAGFKNNFIANIKTFTIP